MNEKEYSELVVEIVKSFVSSGQSCMTAATLGETLSQSVSDQSWRTFGYRTLRGFLATPQFQHSLELTKTAKGALAVKLRVEASSPDPKPTLRYNRIERVVWGAFVMASPPGRRFLNRKTGAVRAGIQAAPSPLDEWAEIAPIAVDKQKAWVQDFLHEKAVPRTGEIDAALGAANWNYRLSSVLGDLSQEWNRYRSAKVAEQVIAWCAEASIAHDLVFQSENAVANNEGPTMPLQSTDSPEEMKRIILAALASLPIEQLLDIPIPSRSIFEAMRSGQRA